MTISHYFPDNTGAGLAILFPVTLLPGQFAMVVFVGTTFNNAAALVVRIRFNESAIPVGCCFSTCTEVLAIGANNVVAAVGCRDTSLNAALLPVVNVPLPKMILKESFVIFVDSPTIGGADTLINNRIDVVYGSLEELAMW